MSRIVRRTVVGIVMVWMCAPVSPLLANGGQGRHHVQDTPLYLYHVEGTGFYYLPGEDGDLFFSLGKWYRRQGESWFVARRFDGPWSGILTQSLPAGLAEVPADPARSLSLGQIPYRYVVDPDEKCRSPYRHFRWDGFDRRPYRDHHRRWSPYRGWMGH